MGGLVNLLPFTYTMILIGSLSLMALPFLTGYYSKDVILEIAYGKFLVTGRFSHWLGTITATITAFYSAKLLALSFFGTPNGSKKIYERLSEAPLIMAIPLFILSIASIFIGFIAKDLFIGIGSTGNGLYPNNYIMFDIEFGLIPLVKFYPLIASLVGIFLAFIIFKPFNTILNKDQILKIFTVSITRFFNQRYWFDNIYNNIFISFGFYLAEITSFNIDQGSVSQLGPNGITIILNSIPRKLSTLDTGFIPHYALYILFSTIFYISLNYLNVTTSFNLLIIIIAIIFIIPKNNI